MDNLGQVVLVKDINPNFSDGYNGSSYPSGSNPRNLIEFNDKLYFTANNGESGLELFVSDGTADGTQLLVDLRPGSNNYGSYPGSLGSFTEFNDKLYFSANNGENGRELFVSDGTAEGTQLLVDLRPGSSSSNPGNLASFIEFNDKLYFAADNGESGSELFVSDGTAEGTQLLVDINPGVDDGYGEPSFPRGSYPRYFTEFNGKLYFSANNGENGQELFVSDGTAEGTQLLLDISPGVDYGYGEPSFPKNSNPRDLIEFNGKLYFSANNGENGQELFVSDGTAEGTQLLVDIDPSVDNGYYGSSYPLNLTEFNGKLYFTADNGESGRELFVSDGTAEGTQLLVDLRPAGSGYSSGSNPSNLVEFNDKLYFSADDGENGRELFVTDGTAEGTQLVADINPDLNYSRFFSGSSPSNLTVVGDELFFSANDGESGFELFKLTFDSVDDTPLLITGSDRSDNLIGSDRSENIQALSGQDTIDSGGGNDTVDGGDGDDIITTASGNNSITGGNGNDTIDSGDGNDTIDGGNGDDILTSLGGDDSLTGGGGNDTIDSGDGNDTLLGGNASDVLTAGSGNDSLTGGGNNDTLNGGDGIDTLSGDNSDDRLIGGSGDDLLFGGSGNDFIDGGTGFDALEGGSGDDVFVLRIGDGTDIIADFNLNGGDRLGLADGLEFNSLSFSGNDILSGAEVLATLNGVDTEQLTEVNFRTL